MLKRLLFWLPIGLLLAGATLRVAVFCQNRSFFIDEANLAMNVAERAPAQFFEALDHAQFAPPFFMVIQKASTAWLGNTEQAMRFFPLLCSLLSLFLLYRLVRHFIPEGWVAWFPAWVMAFSSFLLRYAAEGKQYGPDLAVGLALIFAALHFRPGTKVLHWLVWAVSGAVAIWLSMSSVFVLAGIGAYWLAIYIEQKTAHVLRQLMFCSAAWLGSFALFYQMLLKNSIADGALQASHSAFFLPFLPLNSDQWLQWKNLWATLPYYAAGYTVLAMAVGSVGMLAAAWWLGKAKDKTGLLLIVPILACYGASGLGKYSLMPRLLVWLMPLAILLIGIGWQGVFQRVGRYGQALVVLLLVATAGLHEGYRYFIQPLEVEEIRPVLSQMCAALQPGDLVLIDHEAAPAFRFYREYHKHRAAFSFSNEVVSTNWDFHPDHASVSRNGLLPARVWLIYSHVVSEGTRQQMEADLNAMAQLGTRELEISATGAHGYLYRLGK